MNLIIFRNYLTHLDISTILYLEGKTEELVLLFYFYLILFRLHIINIIKIRVILIKMKYFILTVVYLMKIQCGMIFSFGFLVLDGIII